MFHLDYNSPSVQIPNRPTSSKKQHAQPHNVGTDCSKMLQPRPILPSTSKVVHIISYENSDVLQPSRDGLQPKSGLQPSREKRARKLKQNYTHFLTPDRKRKAS